MGPRPPCRPPLPPLAGDEAPSFPLAPAAQVGAVAYTGAIYGHPGRGLSVGFGIDLGEVKKRAGVALVDVEAPQTEGGQSQQAEEQPFSLCHLSGASSPVPRKP